jgi:gliding motility-associated-like protein
MNNLRFSFFLLTLFCVFDASSQLELDSDTDHAITYSVRNDSVVIFVDVFNDLSFDLDSDGDFGADDDYVYLMFDLNSNGMIDLSGDVDVLYTYNESPTSNICKKYISSPSAVGICENTTGGNASIELKATANNSIPHVFYTFSIPKKELDFGNLSALCGKISVKVHTAGTPIENSATFPKQDDGFDYFVSPFNSIQLFPEAEISLPTGLTAPDKAPIAVCVGDTLKVSKDYPKHHWSGLSANYYQLVLDIPTNEYYFKISDASTKNCVITDTVYVNLLDKKLCEGAYFFPNIVTPNGDGVNDVFELIIGQELKGQDASFWEGSQLKIFNRWGSKVYSTPKDLKGENPRWDCRTDYGKLVTAGTYYYSYVTPGENPQLINGFFSILHSE